jgi:hypothetical protein
VGRVTGTAYVTTAVNDRTGRRGTTLTEAYRLAEQGRHVFFLGRTKRPVGNCPACRDADDSHDRESCICLQCHGFYAATVDPDRIRAMHDATPGGLLAMRTGAPSGVVVVDVDPGNGGNVLDLIARHDVPRTACVRTGSGGHHIYYRHPGVGVPNSAGRLALGVDVRGDGGYVVLPPSVHPRTGRPYVWVRREPVEEMPFALVTACLPPPAAPMPTGTRSTSTAAADGIAHPDRLLAAHLGAVERAAPGARRVTLYGAARGVARMVAAGAVRVDDAVAVLTDAGSRAQQTARDTRRAIEGGFRAEGIRL